MNMLVILIILHLELSVALSREEWETSNNEVDILCRAQVRTVYIIYDIYCYCPSQWELIFFFSVTFSCSSYFLIYMLLSFI